MDFPMSFVVVFDMLKCVRGLESTPKKERKGSLVLHNMNQNDSCTARDVG